MSTYKGDNKCDETQDVLPRPVVLDVCNVGRGAVKKRAFLCCLGVVVCARNFVLRGHKVYGFVPLPYQNTTTDIKFQQLLKELAELGLIAFTPSRRIPMYDESTGRGEQTVQSYDDLFSLECAQRIGGVVVSNDQFADVAQNFEQLSTVISDCRIRVRWIHSSRSGELKMHLTPAPRKDNVNKVLMCGPREDDYSKVCKEQFKVGQRERLVEKLDRIVAAALLEERMNNLKVVDVGRLTLPHPARKVAGKSPKSKFAAKPKTIVEAVDPFGDFGAEEELPPPLLACAPSGKLCNPFDDLHDLASGPQPPTSHFLLPKSPSMPVLIGGSCGRAMQLHTSTSALSTVPSLREPYEPCLLNLLHPSSSNHSTIHLLNWDVMDLNPTLQPITQTPPPPTLPIPQQTPPKRVSVPPPTLPIPQQTPPKRVSVPPPTLPIPQQTPPKRVSVPPPTLPIPQQTPPKRVSVPPPTLPIPQQTPPKRVSVPPPTLPIPQQTPPKRVSVPPPFFLHSIRSQLIEIFPSHELEVDAVVRNHNNVHKLEPLVDAVLMRICK